MAGGWRAENGSLWKLRAEIVIVIHRIVTGFHRKQAMNKQ